MILLENEQLGALMPMHLLLNGDGVIISAGSTLRRLLGEARRVDAVFAPLRAPRPDQDLLELLRRAALTHERIYLQQRSAPNIRLRGQAVIHNETLLVNLSFGIGLVEAVRHLDLTDTDFAPTDSAMELLFLHEANRAIMGELSRITLRLEEARRAAQLQAFTDSLTGLTNRRGAQIALERSLSQCGASDHIPFALAQIDLDHFKSVNDSLGHGAGDAVLVRVGEILREETRLGDTVARTGGDEFLLILPGAGTDQGLLRLGERIIRRIEAPIATDYGECKVSASIGFARVSHGTISADAILSETDAALYASKRAGRGRVTIVTQSGAEREAPQ